MEILEIIHINPYQIAICFMLFSLIFSTALSLFSNMKAKNDMIKDLILRDKKRNYERFCDITCFDQDFELFCLLNDEMYTLLFNVAHVGYIDRIEFESIYDKLLSGVNYNQKSFRVFYPNWINIMKFFKTEKINSKIFFEMFFSKR